jgi:hypothetical protein
MVLVGSILVASEARSQMWGLNPTAVEIAQLPQFCYGQMNVPNATGPQYSFPRQCGPGMNHYCPGLVHLIRAKKGANKGQAVQSLRKAETMTGYTQDWLKNFPECPLRDHVDATKVEVRNLLRMYGTEPSKRK